MGSDAKLAWLCWEWLTYYKKLSLIQVKLIVMPLTIGQWHIKEKTTYWFKNSKNKWGTKIKTKEVNLLLSKRTSMLLGLICTNIMHRTGAI